MPLAFVAHEKPFLVFCILWNMLLSPFTTASKQLNKIRHTVKYCVASGFATSLYCHIEQVPTLSCSWHCPDLLRERTLGIMHGIPAVCPGNTDMFLLWEVWSLVYHRLSQKRVIRYFRIPPVCISSCLMTPTSLFSYTSLFPEVVLGFLVCNVSEGRNTHEYNHWMRNSSSRSYSEYQVQQLCQPF